METVSLPYITEDQNIQNINDNTYCICLQEINKDDNSYIIPECQHRFHSNCVISWFRYNSSFPYCRCIPCYSNNGFIHLTIDIN